MCKPRKQYKLKATIFDKRGRKLAEGENSYWKTHPMQVNLATKVGRPDAIFMHAEIQALVRVKDLSKAHSIYIERYGDDGTPLPAKPCEICSAALEHAGITKVEYT